MRTTLANPLLLAVFLAAAALCAQETSTVDLRHTIPVTVLDRKGVLVRGLTPQNFQAEFKGQPVRIVSAESDAQPRRIVILLDTSSSMAWGSKWTLARKGAEDIMMHVRPENQIAVLLFSDKITSRIDFGQGGPMGLTRLNSLPAELDLASAGRTALLDALAEALRLLEPAHPGDSVYVITDGGDNVSKSTIDQIKNALACSAARLFFLLIREADEPYRGLEYRYGPYLAYELAELTGGNVAAPVIVDREAVGAAARSLYQQIMEFYLMEIDLPQPIDKRRRWSLKVVDDHGKKTPGVEIAYPRQLAPCPVAPQAHR